MAAAEIELYSLTRLSLEHRNPSLKKILLLIAIRPGKASEKGRYIRLVACFSGEGRTVSHTGRTLCSSNGPVAFVSNLVYGSGEHS